MTLIDPDDYKNAPEGDPTYAAIILKTPKRVLHFSDGVLEEYSDDEIDCSPTENKAVVDSARLSWGPWAWYKLWCAGSSTLKYLDSAGEFMASFLGITTPKYYFELEEYKKRKSTEDAQKNGWSEPNSTSRKDIEFTDIHTTQPSVPAVV